jgi:hypothetical protein
MIAFRVLAATALLAAAPAFATPPIMLFQQGKPVADAAAAGGARTGLAVMRLPCGHFAFYDRYRPAGEPLVLPDADGNGHSLRPALPPSIAGSQAVVESGVLANGQVILTPDDRVVSVFVKGEPIDAATQREVGLPRFLDVWVRHASLDRAFAPRMIWRGYNGSQMEYQQLAGGRIVVPYGSMQPHGRAAPPTGRHKVIVQYSDDGGATWRESESQLTSPCYPGFNGSNEGACEPAVEPLEDGRLWMLMRTQAGFLYESHSDDDGTTWRPATASRFHASTGPPNIMRHANGWLVVCWNNCELPPRHGGAGVYGGRDALHIAVSDDDGKTWRGFREVYLDHRRNDNPARTGDRGTAYPLAAYDADGTIVVIAGQGEGGRNPILVDPRWVVATEAHTDFSDGLAEWSVYKHHGPAKGWWRARAAGAVLVADPTDPDARCLHLRKPDDLPPDGATWNFPNGWKGTLTTRVMLRAGHQGGAICLTDRMFDPTNDHGERFAVFQAQIDRDGRLGRATLQPDRWHEVTLKWDLGVPECRLLVDGALADTLKVRHPTLNGINYVRFRSTAEGVDPSGFLVGGVRVSIDDPRAPACTPADQSRHEQRYVETMVPLWTDPSDQ